VEKQRRQLVRQRGEDVGGGMLVDPEPGGRDERQRPDAARLDPLETVGGIARSEVEK
jgi:hypothetical protein